MRSLFSMIAAFGLLGAPALARADDPTDDPGEHSQGQTGGSDTPSHADPATKTLPTTASATAKANAFGQQGARMRAAHQAARDAAADQAKSAAAEHRQNGASHGPNSHANAHAANHAANAHAANAAANGHAHPH